MREKEPLTVAPEPCGSCPYRRDVPSGVWAAEEYEKLLGYAGPVTPERIPCLHIFLCHQTHALGRRTVCRGWLAVERESLAAKLAVLRGQIRGEDLLAPVTTPLFDSGAQAAAYGLRAVRRPGEAARRLVARLIRKLGLEER